MAELLRVKIINPDQVVFDGEAEYVLAPGVKGWLGILPGHTPYFGELVPGEIIIHTPTEQRFAVESGLIRVRADSLTILIGI